MRRSGAAYAVVAAWLLATTARAADPPPSPSEFLGFPVGADRQLADYTQIVAYFRALAASSERVEIESLGPTTLGNDLILAVISSEENIRNLARHRDIAGKLADPRGLAPTQVDALVREGRAVVLVTCNIHSTEIAASQMAMEWAHALATSRDPEVERRLSEVILLLVPSLNPDGQIMEVEWYRKQLGTRYEGGRMPWLYHHYVGHDNNRDWYMLTQKETRGLNRALFGRWFPQVWLDEHQMGSTGPRMFVPPFTNPVAEQVHPLVWRGVDQIGSLMGWRLEQAGKAGVGSGFAYDAYWPGGTMNTAWWKNVFGLLTEVASARMATPVELHPSELTGMRKGLVEHRSQVNYPHPWPGGTWRLRDVMDYERIASDALLEACADRREDLLRGVAAMARDAVASAPAAEHYRIPRAQRDSVAAARLAHLLAEHGVEVRVSADGRDFLVPAAQPYGRFVAEMLGVQRYPEVRPAPGAPAMPPYDVSAWSLPLLMDVSVEKVAVREADRATLRPLAPEDWPEGGVEAGPAAVYALSRAGNAGTAFVNDVLARKLGVSVARAGFDAGAERFPAGTFLVDASPRLQELAVRHRVGLRPVAQRPAADPLRRVRVGLYKPWLASMDEGWTRWILEQYGFEPVSLDNRAIRAGGLEAAYDAIVLPDVDRHVIVDGRPRAEEGESSYFPELPPDYAGGIGREGVQQLKQFVDKGGTLVALASSGELVLGEFNVPVRNVLARARAEEFHCPGSILRLHLDPGHPVTYGMPEVVGAFQTERIAYQTLVPGAEAGRRVLAWYPDDAEDVLLSGWIRGADRLERRAAAVALTQGRGKIVLLGFRVQHRAQTEGTFKLLFNALHWAGTSGLPAEP